MARDENIEKMMSMVVVGIMTSEKNEIEKMRFHSPSILYMLCDTKYSVTTTTS